MQDKLKKAIEQLPSKQVTAQMADANDLCDDQLRELPQGANWVLIETDNLIAPEFNHFSQEAISLLILLLEPEIDTMILEGRLPQNLLDEYSEAYGGYGSSNDSTIKKAQAEAVHFAGHNGHGAVIVDSRILDSLGINTAQIAQMDEEPRPLSPIKNIPSQQAEAPSVTHSGQGLTADRSAPDPSKPETWNWQR